MLTHRKRGLNSFLVRKHIKRSVLHAISSQNDQVGDLEKFHSDSLQISSHPFRILWFLIGLICFMICCYQVYDRINYYLSSPTTIDVKTSTDPITMPPLRIGGVDTDLMKPYWNLSKVVTDETCTDLFAEFFESKPNVTNYTEFWEATNILPNVESISVRDIPGGNYLARVSLNNGKLSKSMNSELIKWHSRNLFKGSHTIFELTKKINMKTIFNIELRHSGLCKVSGVMLASEGLLPQQHVLLAMFGTFWKYRYIIKKNIFLNTRNSPCVSNEELKKCYHNCVVKIYRKFQCRLPFMPAEVKLVDCSKFYNRIDIKKLINSGLDMLEETQPETTCGCHKTCNQQSIVLKLSYDSINDTKILRLNYANQEENIVIMKEKFIYDGIALLVDVGGSLCLSLGLCVLSIIKIIHSTAVRFHKTRNVVDGKVGKQYDVAVEKELKKILQLQTRSSSYWITIPKIIVVVTLVIFFIFLSFQKISFYFGNPVQTTITILVLRTIYLPNLITCGESNQTVDLKNKLAEKNKINACDLHFLDLLPLVDGSTIEELWKTRKLQMNIPEKKPIYTSEVIPMHSGSCSEVSFNRSQNYAERPAYVLLKFWSSKIENCSGDPFEVYVRSRDSNIYSSILTKLDIRTGSNDAIYIETSRMSRYNSSTKPCVAREQYETCAKNCYENKIRSTVHCRLPFFNNVTQPWCNTVESAKTSYNAFLNIVSSTDVKRDCNCLPQCVRERYKLYWLLQLASNLTKTVVILAPLNNFIENLVEIPVYSLIALLCDIGNILGITLGLSLLSISHISLAFYKTMHLRYIRSDAIQCRH